MIFRSLRFFLSVLLILPFAFCFAGGIRFYTGSPLGLSLLSALPVFSVFLYQQYRKIVFAEPSQAIFCLLIFLYFVLRLYNSELGALVAFGCADAANHLSHYQKFIASDSTAYNGFNALYVNWWFNQVALGLSIQSALTLALLAPVFCISYLLSLVFPVFTESFKDHWKTAVLICAVVITSETSILPALHYNQSDGYLAHLYSVAPVLFLIFFAKSLKPFWLLTCVIVTRFSYGLQWPDLLAALSMYLGISALRSHDKTERRKLATLSISCVALAAIGLHLLTPVFSLSGSIVSQNRDYAFATQIATIALLIAGRSGNCLELWFLTANCFIQAFWLLTTAEGEYYFTKLFLYSSLISSVVLVRELRSILDSKVIVRAIAWSCVCLSLVMTQRPYINSYFERSFANSPYKLLSPLVDSKVSEIVDTVLQSKQRNFFLYFTSRWPQFAYFNSLRQAHGSFEIFSDPPQVLPANSCIFWSNNSNDLFRLLKYPVPDAANWLEKINLRKDAQIVKYKVKWAGQQVIKYICSDDAELRLIN